jgi:hypothetical protein
LLSLIQDDHADREARTVAGAILRLVHTVSDADKTALRRLLDSRKQS